MLTFVKLSVIVGARGPRPSNNVGWKTQTIQVESMVDCRSIFIMSTLKHQFWKIDLQKPDLARGLSVPHRHATSLKRTKTHTQLKNM